MNFSITPAVLCTTNAVNAVDAAITSSGTATSFSWTVSAPANMNITYTLSAVAADIINMTVTGCGVYTVVTQGYIMGNIPVLSPLLRTATVTCGILPIVTTTNSSGNATVCAGTSATLSASGANSYYWPQLGIQGASVVVSPTSTTCYYVQGENIPGCSAGANAGCVYVRPPAPLNMSGNFTICNGSTATLLASGASSYAWSNGATGNTVTLSPTVTTSYSITGNDGFCDNSLSFNVFVNAKPTLTVSPAQATICATSSLQFTATGASTYSWNGVAGNNTISITPASTSIYTVTGTNSFGCSDVAFAMVTVNPKPVIAVAPAQVSVCATTSLQLSASGASSYSWSDGGSVTTSNSIIITPTLAGTYTVTGTNSFGCSDVAFVPVFINPDPVVTITPSQATVCETTSLQLTATGAPNFYWTNGGLIFTGNSPTITPVSTSIYTFTGTSFFGCYATGFATVVVNPKPFITVAPSQTLICSNSPVNLAAAGALSYTWINATATFTGSSVSVTPSVNTTYTVTGTDGPGCSNTATVSVSIEPLLLTAAVSESVVCEGNYTSINLLGATSYSIDGIASPASFTLAPTSSSNYTSSGTTALGCLNSVSFSLSVTPCLSIDALKKEITFVVSPNPSQAVFNVRITTGFTNGRLVILNTMGQYIFTQIISSDVFEINLEKLPAGLYYATFSNNELNQTVKLVKE